MTTFFKVTLMILGAQIGAQEMLMTSTFDSPALFEAFKVTYADAGIELKIEVLPAGRSISMTEKGEAAALAFGQPIIDSTFSTKVLRIGFGQEPFTYMNILAYVNRSDGEKWMNPGSWPRARIGYILGIPISRYYADQVGSRVLVEAPDYELAVKMLLAGRFDILFVTEGLLNGFQTRNPEIMPLEKPVARVPYWHILPEKYTSTDLEKKIRESFIKHRGLFAAALKEFLRKN